MNIPRIIHQTWKSEEIPPAFKIFQHSWQSNHPLWLHMLWTDEMNREFIESNYPHFLSIYDGYATNIQRVDAARYFILYHYGGVYVDLDFLCLRNIEPILEGESCVLGREPDEHCKIHKKKIIVSNAFIASTPRHDFISALCGEVSNPIRAAYSRNDRILESTGPFMLTRSYERFDLKQQVKLLPHNILYPLNKSELGKLSATDQVTSKFSEKLENAYAIHYYWGSWWKRVREKRTISILGLRFRIYFFKT